MEQAISDYKIYIELREIIKYLEPKIKNKIPQRLIEKLNSVNYSDYKFVYDFSKELNEQKVQSKTKELLSGIYLKYCCDEPRKTELINKCKSNDEEYYKSVEINFNKVGLSDSNVREETLDLTVVKESIFSRIINKIKNIFRR